MDKARIKDKLVEFNQKAFEASSIGLLGGKMGSILFGSHLNSMTHSNSEWEICLDGLFEEINSDHFDFQSFNYSVGLTGFCFGMNHLHQCGFIDFDPDEHLEDFDETLYNVAQQTIAEGHVDFLHEGMGILHYFNQRSSNEKIRNYTADIVVTFLSNITKRNDAFYYPSTIGGMSGVGCDLGLAHGLCGQLLILMNTWNNDILKEPIAEALRTGLDFILSLREPATKDRLSLYPTGIRFENEERIFYERNAWCYGDINQALLFYKGHAILGDQKYLNEANLIGDAICDRLTYESNVIDKNSHFCHGSSGMAQFYYGLFRVSRQQRYQNQYEYWIKRTAEDFCEDLSSGILGAKQYQLLDGMGAAGMTLTSYILDDDRNWDRLFLLH